VVERLVLVKDHEDVLHLLTQKRNRLLERPAIILERHRVGDHSHAADRGGHGYFVMISDSHAIYTPSSLPPGAAMP
jgi:hypothetical protein